MQTNLQLIRNACIAANKEILEFKPGCLFKLKDTDNKRIYTYLHSHEDSSGNIFYATAEGYNPNFLCVGEILGRKIGLPDVLLAMQSLGDDNWQRHWCVNRLGEFLNDSKPGFEGAPFSVVGEKWDLSKTLEDQTEETKAFLASLLSEK